jgi:hypothetical protein
MGSDPSGWSSNQLSAYLNMALNTSMTRRKSIGDNGSPYRSSHAWQTRSPGASLSRTFVLAEDSSTDTQSRHTLENPTTSIT